MYTFQTKLSKISSYLICHIVLVLNLCVIFVCVILLLNFTHEHIKCDYHGVITVMFVL